MDVFHVSTVLGGCWSLALQRGAELSWKNLAVRILPLLFQQVRIAVFDMKIRVWEGKEHQRGSTVQTLSLT